MVSGYWQHTWDVTNLAFALLTRTDTASLISHGMFQKVLLGRGGESNYHV